MRSRDAAMRSRGMTRNLAMNGKGYRLAAARARRAVGQRAREQTRREGQHEGGGQGQGAQWRSNTHGRAVRNVAALLPSIAQLRCPLAAITSADSQPGVRRCDQSDEMTSASVQGAPLDSARRLRDKARPLVSTLNMTTGVPTAVRVQIERPPCLDNEKFRALCR